MDYSLLAICVYVLYSYSLYSNVCGCACHVHVKNICGHTHYEERHNFLLMSYLVFDDHATPFSKKSTYIVFVYNGFCDRFRLMQ